MTGEEVVIRFDSDSEVLALVRADGTTELLWPDDRDSTVVAREVLEGWVVRLNEEVRLRSAVAELRSRLGGDQ